MPELIWQNEVALSILPTTSDLDIIQQLEQYYNIRLRLLSNKLSGNSYTLNSENQVTGLELSGIRSLTELPVFIFSLTHLQKLSLTGIGGSFSEKEGDSKLFPHIKQLQNLTELSLKRNNLKQLPPEIGQLQNLIKLDLENNKLETLPAEIGQLQNLNSLNLNANDLTSLPAEIGQLQNLSSLNLSGNNLTSIPAEIGQLQNLTRFEITRNERLTSLPAEISSPHLIWDCLIWGCSQTICKQHRKQDSSVFGDNAS
jgi:Leucine-rich repeat (LRR) protein